VCSGHGGATTRARHGGAGAGLAGAAARSGHGSAGAKQGQRGGVASRPQHGAGAATRLGHGSVGAEWGRGTAALVQAPDQRELLDGWEAEFMAWWQVEEARAEAQRPHAGAGSEGGVEPPPDVVRAVMGLGVAEVIGGVAVGLR